MYSDAGEPVAGSAPGEDRTDPNWWERRYREGDSPWDTGITPPEVVSLVESGAVERGWALDLGCGSGVTSRYLAAHGFRVVGLDLSHFALSRGKRAAEAADLASYFVRASVADLSFLRMSATVAVDVGCFHSLPPEARTAYVRTLADHLVLGGHYLLYTFIRPAQWERVSSDN